MNFDISHLLQRWDYQPGQLTVRRFTGRDGAQKIQLRLDLGLLQMNAEGRPDGKRPMGHPSLLEFHQVRLAQYRGDHDNNDDGFLLKAEECAKLHLEALQYHHRYVCLLELGDYDGVIRDAERNLAVFDLVVRYAESDDVSWALQQFRPQLLMMRTRAKAMRFLDKKNYSAAISEIDGGLEEMRQFCRDNASRGVTDQIAEMQYLENWLRDIRAARPLSKREKLELALHEAVREENYEKAAQVRDALRNLKGNE